MTSFNETVDKAVLKPVATAYTDVLPSPVRTGVNNFFANLGDAWSLREQRPSSCAPNRRSNSLVRITIVNTFFGLGGVLDIATEMRIERRQTGLRPDAGALGRAFGAVSGAAFTGALRRCATRRTLPADWYGDLARQVDPVSDRNMLYALRIVDTRASLLTAGNVLERRGARQIQLHARRLSANARPTRAETRGGCGQCR